MDHAMKYPQPGVALPPLNPHLERACLAHLAVLVSGLMLCSACAGAQRRQTEVLTSSTLIEMGNEINTGTKVHLAVVGFASTSASREFLSAKGLDPIQWRENSAAATVARAERTCLKFFSKYRNFDMVDRSTLGTIMDEVARSGQPEMSEDTRLKIALTGANYILIARMDVVPGGRRGRPGWHSEYNFRLVKTESGRLLAVDSWHEGLK